MNEKQRDYITSIIKIVFTIMFGGLAAGRLFELSLNLTSYMISILSMTLILIAGYFLQRG